MFQASGSKFDVSGFRFIVSGLAFLLSRFSFEVVVRKSAAANNSCAQNVKPETRNKISITNCSCLPPKFVEPKIKHYERSR